MIGASLRRRCRPLAGAVIRSLSIANSGRSRRDKAGYRVHLPFGILTGPGWKNSSGIITPSFLNTIPFFITN